MINDIFDEDLDQYYAFPCRIPYPILLLISKNDKAKIYEISYYIDDIAIFMCHFKEIIEADFILKSDSYDEYRLLICMIEDHLKLPIDFILKK